MNYSNNIISDSISIKEALALLNEVPDTLTLFVIDAQSVLIGALTDGDIRRAILNNVDMNQPLISFINKDFKFLSDKRYDLSKVKEYRDRGVILLPILDNDRKIVDVINLSEKRSILPIDAVIMAGGLGSRLRPMTLEKPKPLLQVGDKPIVEYNVDRLSLYGIKNITFSIKYLGQQIVDYFKDGKDRALNIGYVKEDKPLGTLGSVTLFSDYQHDYILVMNSDILTNIDFEDMYQSIIEEDADMIVATTPYEVKVPYGVVETVDGCVVGLKEKPTYTYYSNAGIYIFKKEFLDVIPVNEHYNATDFIEDLIKMNKKVANYPIRGYWLDIGKPEDFTKAQEDIKHIVF